MRLLAIESSCDDTAAAVLVDGDVRSSVVASQDAVHSGYGGVVPELASRSHMRALLPTIENALRDADLTLDEIDAVGATYGPGLVGSLLVGLCAAKSIAFARRLPFVGVNHLEGHLISVQLEQAVSFPYVALLASGGHTALYLARALGDYARLGATRDDAAGEAFDKGARLLGLPYPGGPALQQLAATGDPAAFDFPIAAGVPGLDFSFAGLKTSLLYKVRDLGDGAEALRPDLAASYQHAIVEALTLRVERGLATAGLTRLAVGGGVAANGPLRERLAGLGVDLHVPERALCTDNAAMIGSAARWVAPLTEYGDLEVYASGERGL